MLAYELATHTAVGLKAPPQLLGAVCTGPATCQFSVWAPKAKSVQVVLHDEERELPLTPLEYGYHAGIFPNVMPGTKYNLLLDGEKKRADPASRLQPEGVFGPSEVLDLDSFEWTDQHWRGKELKDYLLYELHVGTFSRSGTLAEAIRHLDELKSLGITAIEVMPVAQFSGNRNWGYDGVFPFAVQNSYGGARGLQLFVDACHQREIAVVLDVVYNHLGPEGNFLSDFGPYFTKRYQTPWGDAINFDGPESDHVVRYFLENALYWLRDLHIDALRLDAIHGIFDRNAQPFLSLLSKAVQHLAHETQRHIHLIAESDLNDPRYLMASGSGGYGLSAQWNDDFHHALHALQSNERTGYYVDFGSIHHLQKALSDGYVYTGQYSEYRKQRHGSPSSDIAPSQFIVFSQNHDQVGNRMMGERSSSLLSFDALKLSAGVVLLSSNIPLLFMGEEYGETAPFLYFTSHADQELGKAVRDGRRREFAGFQLDGTAPDPQDETTFLRSKLDQDLRLHGHHHVLWRVYKRLIEVRKSLSLICQAKTVVATIGRSEFSKALRLQRTFDQFEVLAYFNLGEERVDIASTIPDGLWRKCFDSADTEWLGPGSLVPFEITPRSCDNLFLIEKSFCVFRRLDFATEVKTLPEIGESK